MDRKGLAMEVLELASLTSARARGGDDGGARTPIGGGMRCGFLKLAPVRREELMGGGSIGLV